MFKPPYTFSYIDYEQYLFHGKNFHDNTKNLFLSIYIYLVGLPAEGGGGEDVVGPADHLCSFVFPHHYPKIQKIVIVKKKIFSCSKYVYIVVVT